MQRAGKEPWNWRNHLDCRAALRAMPITLYLVALHARLRSTNDFSEGRRYPMRRRHRHSGSNLLRVLGARLRKEEFRANGENEFGTGHAAQLGWTA